METQELNIIPISMRCTQEQYKSIKPILDANGISNDFVFSYADTFLVTNYSDDIVVMNTLSIDAEKFGRTLFTEWDEKIFLKCLGIETKELKVGDYIRGFKYDCHEGLEYRMNSHIGQIAIIVERHRGLIKVEFEDNSIWYYPHNLAIEHLVDPLEDTPFNKPDFSHLREKIEKGVNIRFESKSVEDLKLDSLKREMETKTIKVGDYIRGFKYKCAKDLVERMNSHVNKIGKVIEYTKNVIKVEFEDGFTWWYPKDLAIEHLVDTLEYTPFHKPDFSHLLDVDKVLEKGIKNSGLNDKPIEELEEHFKDNINPQHYKNKPKETIERIGDNLSLEEFKGYLKGNILKYLDRYENKNGVEDLRKMQWYLNKLIEIENGN